MKFSKGKITASNGKVTSESVIIGALRYKFSEGVYCIEQTDTITNRKHIQQVPEGFTLENFRTFIKGVSRVNLTGTI